MLKRSVVKENFAYIASSCVANLEVLRVPFEPFVFVYSVKCRRSINEVDFKPCRYNLMLHRASPKLTQKILDRPELLQYQFWLMVGAAT
jgi:hypothetical protein